LPRPEIRDPTGDELMTARGDRSRKIRADHSATNLRGGRNFKRNRQESVARQNRNAAAVNLVQVAPASESSLSARGSSWISGVGVNAPTAGEGRALSLWPAQPRRRRQRMGRSCFCPKERIAHRL
jgi:hypothetical protein